MSDDRQAIVQAQVSIFLNHDYSLSLTYSQVRKEFGLVINCGESELAKDLLNSLKDDGVEYLHVPLPVLVGYLVSSVCTSFSPKSMQHGKRDKQKVGPLLVSALSAAYRHLQAARSVLLFDSQSLSVASFLCMAMLLRFFDGSSFPPRCPMRAHLSFRPSVG